MTKDELDKRRNSLIQKFESNINLIRNDVGSEECGHPLTEYDDRWCDYYCLVCNRAVE